MKEGRPRGSSGKARKEGAKSTRKNKAAETHLDGLRRDSGGRGLGGVLSLGADDQSAARGGRSGRRAAGGEGRAGDGADSESHFGLLRWWELDVGGGDGEGEESRRDL